MRFGVPYQGSKNGIVPWVLSNIPAGDTFVDLFAGGCAVTHGALLSKKYEHFICNDIGRAPQLFKDAIAGKFKNERRWISREKFAELKDRDLYVRWCWSFGNNGDTYLYSREVEPWKRALHFARVFGDCSKLAEFGIKSDGSVADIRKNEQAYKAKYIEWWLEQQEYSAEDLERLISMTQADIERNSEELRLYLCESLRASGLSQSEVNKRLGTQMAGHYFGKSQWAFPTREMYNQMRAFMPLLPYDEVAGLQDLWQSLQSLQSLQRLQRLQRLQSLQSLQSLQRLQRLESLQRLQSLQSLQSLQRLQRLESLQSLEILNLDYREVPIPEDAVVYADPPYRGTRGYEGGFDFDAFDEWLRSRAFPVYVSEYTMPEDFVCIAERKKMALYSAQTNKVTTERLFLHKKWVK